ncbi:MAG: CDP-alcohol phosphatidyltransferase family protein [Eubacteriales bacterium]|jgi:CDP-diacylglycerol--serine O-phosphatidyltransferase|nr:CDP-alcohol phosphatidyltransferase family protein [Eubacteriales bacterium]
MVGFYNYTVILTYFGVVSAVVGIGLSMYGRTSMAVVCLMVSGFCDLFDGTIARTMKRTQNERKFGIQIDSLADMVCFGVLPAAIGFSIGLTHWYESAALIIYVLAALIRLAYYNVTEDELEFSDNVQRVYYDGLPVTTAAILIPLIYTLRPVMKSGFLLLYALCLLATAAAFLTKVKVRKLGMKGMIVAAFCGLAVLALLIVGWNSAAA